MAFVAFGSVKANGLLRMHCEVLIITGYSLGQSQMWAVLAFKGTKCSPR